MMHLCIKSHTLEALVFEKRAKQANEYCSVKIEKLINIRKVNVLRQTQYSISVYNT